MRLLIKVAPVPDPVALGVSPVSKKPDFLGAVKRTEDFHPDEPGLPIHQVGAISERFLDLGGLFIGDNEFTERDKCCGLRGGSRKERGTDGSDDSVERTMAAHRRWRSIARNSSDFSF